MRATRPEAPREPAADLDLDGCRRMAVAVLLSGLRLPAEARAAWLTSTMFADWCEVLNLSPAEVRRLTAALDSQAGGGVLEEV